MKEREKEKTKEEKERESRIMDAVCLVGFLALAMVGLRIIQVVYKVVLENPQVNMFVPSVFGWFLLVVGFAFFIAVIPILDAAYRHYPDKLRRLVILMIVPGLAMMLVVSGRDARVDFTSFWMTFFAFGFCLAGSGIYLMLRRKIFWGRN